MRDNNGIFEQLIIDESASLRRAALISRMAGRTLFTSIIVVFSFWTPEPIKLVPLAFFVIVLAFLWLFETVIAQQRSQQISRLIAETDYSGDPHGGSIFIRSHYARYGDTLGALANYLTVIEPILWVALALWLLFISGKLVMK
jgi:hypothetical protein